MKPQNIILITVDALRADHLSCYGYPRETTPNINQLAKESIVFENAFTNAPYTTAAITALQTSTYLHFQPAPILDFSTKLTLAEVLGRKGYDTMGIQTNPWFPIYHFGKGFQTFIDPLDATFIRRAASLATHARLDKTSLLHRVLQKLYDTYQRGRAAIAWSQNRLICPYARAETMNQTIEINLPQLSDPFYLWLHYMDPHEPYYPQQYHFGPSISYEKLKYYFETMIKNPSLLSTDDHHIIINLYDTEVRYLDEQLGILFTTLKTYCNLEESIVVFTADHGQALGERGYYGHAGANMPITLFDELLHIPLLLWSASPEIVAEIAHQLGTRHVDRAIGLIDIAPFLLDLIGLEIPRAFVGTSPLSSSSMKPSILAHGVQCVDPNYSEYLNTGEIVYAYRTNEYKLVLLPDNIQVFDLIMDPHEVKNISRQQPDLTQDLVQQLLDDVTSLTSLTPRSHKDRIRQCIAELKVQKTL